MAFCGFAANHVFKKSSLARKENLDEPVGTRKVINTGNE
jgi:hypothetical protein